MMSSQQSLPSVTWVVGVGPSKGLGAALARRFARGGSTAVITGRNEARLQSVAAEIRDSGFNAGNMVRGAALEVTPEQFESTWRGSAYAGFLFVRASLPLLLDSGGGSLLLTGATASVRGGGPFIAFASAKAALRSIAQSAAREYGPRGVHVAHVVIDGAIDGERLRTVAPDHVAQAGENGLLDPDAIADTYWHLHQQPRSAWTHEVDLRPFKERF